jgi:hypothetical protein
LSWLTLMWVSLCAGAAALVVDGQTARHETHTDDGMEPDWWHTDICKVPYTKTDVREIVMHIPCEALRHGVEM